MSDIISGATISNVVDDLAYFGYGQRMNSTEVAMTTMSDKTLATLGFGALVPLGLLVGIVIALILRSRTRTRAASSKGPKGGKDRGLDLPEVDPVVKSRSIDLPVDPVKSRSVITSEIHSDTDSVSDFEDELTAESPTRPVKQSSRDEVVEDLVMEDADETKTGKDVEEEAMKETGVGADETNTCGEVAEAIVSTNTCRRISEETVAKPAAAEEDKTKSPQVKKKEVVGTVKQDQEQLRDFLAKTDSERLESLRSANIRSIDDLRKSKLEDLSKIVPRQVARRLFSYATAIPKTVWSSMPSFVWPRMHTTSPRRLCASS